MVLVKKFCKKNSISSKTLEQSNGWWQIRKENKAQEQQDDAYHKWKGKGAEPARKCEPVHDPEGTQDTGYEGCNIQCHYIFPKNAAIGVKEHRNKKGPGKNPTTQRTGDTGIFLLQSLIHIKRIQKHREKQKLHMLPGGFIHRYKKADQRVLPTPVVHKV